MTEIIGNTPLFYLEGLSEKEDVHIYAKLEYFNPTGSIKDRIAKNIIEGAEKAGKLVPGMKIVEASSGNTGASVAMVAAVKGYPCTIITKSSTSCEKKNTIRSFGAELLISPPGVSVNSPDHYQNIAHKLSKEDNTFYLNQYDSPDNPASYYKTLGPEIISSLPKVDYFVATASTGGTISGTGTFLKEKCPDCKVILADPYGSILCHYVKTNEITEFKSNLVEGSGKASIPLAFDKNIIDDVIQIVDKDGIKMCHLLSKKYGIFAGGSGGLNVSAAVKLSQTIDKGNIVTIIPDSGFKYLSKYYNKEWLAGHQIYI